MPSWAADPNNVMHGLAMNMASRHFEDLIEAGVGTREEFAGLFLTYAKMHPGGIGLGELAEQLRGELDTWLETRPKAERPTISEMILPSSTDRTE